MRPIYDAKFRGEIRKRMSPPSRETVTEISRATGISRQTLYSWRHLWKREGVFTTGNLPYGAKGLLPTIYIQTGIANPKRWSRSIRCWKQPDLACINEPSATQQTSLKVTLAREAKNASKGDICPSSCRSPGIRKQPSPYSSNPTLP